MRALLGSLVVVMALAVPAVAAADVVSAGGASTAGGMKWSWSADYDTATNTLTFQCDLVNADDGVTPVSPTATMVAEVDVTLANGQVRVLDCVPLMNLGPQVSKVNLKVANAGRWSGFFVHTSFVP